MSGILRLLEGIHNQLSAVHIKDLIVIFLKRFSKKLEIGQILYKSKSLNKEHISMLLEAMEKNTSLSNNVLEVTMEVINKLDDGQISQLCGISLKFKGLLFGSFLGKIEKMPQKINNSHINLFIKELDSKIPEVRENSLGALEVLSEKISADQKKLIQKKISEPRSLNEYRLAIKLDLKFEENPVDLLLNALLQENDMSREIGFVLSLRYLVNFFDENQTEKIP